MNNSLARFAGTVTAAIALASCGKTTPITSGTATPSPPFVPHVSAEYPIPTASSSAQNIVSNATALYFTEEAADQIGELTLSETIAEFPVPTSCAQPLSIRDWASAVRANPPISSAARCSDARRTSTSRVCAYGARGSS